MSEQNLKIVVCVKQVAVAYHPSALDLKTGRLDPEKIVTMLNPYDEIAVEQALRIKASFPNAEVLLVSAGSAVAESALRDACALGGAQIDRLVRIDCEVTDSWSIALVLSRFLAGQDVDLILCGKKAIDSNNALVGGMLAELLQLPQISDVVRLELLFEQDMLRVVSERYLGKGDRDEVECGLPALLTVDFGLNEPRYPRLRDRIFAAKADIEVLSAASSGSDSDQDIALSSVRKYSLPRPKTRKVFTPDSDLSVADRINQMMTGGSQIKENSTSVLGSADEKAEQFLSFLTEQNLLN